MNLMDTQLKPQEFIKHFLCYKDKRNTLESLQIYLTL